MSAPKAQTEPLSIESLDHEGRGVAHLDGKAIFVEGALPGERVLHVSFRRKPSYEIAQVTQILTASASRVTPRCKWFGTCGGCSHQHMHESAQVAAKQRVLEDCFDHIGKVVPETMLPPIHGPAWGYRTRARLSVRNVVKKGGVLVGFHEKKSSYVADMDSCEILPPHVSALLPLLRGLVESLSIRDRLPQIELAQGEQVTVLVLRILEPLTPEDEAKLKAFADAHQVPHQVQFWLQTKGPDTAAPFYPLDAPELNYTLPEFGLVMPFRPTEFTQVNHGINRMLIRRAMRMLHPRPGERIADFFCGLGNFSLPIARCGAHVVGIEGSSGLVQRAIQNAARNHLSEFASFREADLFQITAEDYAALGPFDKLLIDPPRDGAIELVKALPEHGAPTRIVYVSCSPSTLARDAAVLVHQKGYKLKAAGVANMFPHTAHVESIALFER